MSDLARTILESTRRALRRLHKEADKAVLRLMLPRRRRAEVVRLGSRYGGWWVPVGDLSERSICYSAGVGEDITFDLELIRLVGCSVVALDPTPHAVRYMSAQRLPRELTFLPVGLAGWSGMARFYEPRVEGNVSFSINNLQGTDRWVDAPVRDLRSVMEETAHTRVDLLKMDIEGSEHEVIRSALAAGVRPGILCVEFDRPYSYRTLRGTIGALTAAGYDPLVVEGLNVTFSRAQPVSADEGAGA
jgi:FkbM family methyltransferase